MMGLDDFLIGIITNGIVAWLADKDAKIEDAQRKRLKEIIARIERSRTSPDKLRLLASQSLREACAKSPGLQKNADAIMSDPMLARDLTVWLLEPDPNNYDAGKTQITGMLCDRFECGRFDVDALLSSLEQGVNADLQLGQLRGHNEHRLILKTLHEQTDWQARIERDNAYMVAMLERLLVATALPGARPLRPQSRPWTRKNKLLSGSKPRVEDIEEGLDFRRTIHEKVMTAIRVAEPPALFAFLGDQQMGKTTFLLRIGIELALEGYPVLEPNSSLGGEPYANWVIQHAEALKDKRPLILLIDDPRLGGENFQRQMTALYDQKARIIVLAAENWSDWNRVRLSETPLHSDARMHGVGNADREAIALVEHLERQGAIQIDSDKRAQLLDDVRQIEGRPGFFETVIGTASGDKYKSVSTIVRERLEEAGDSAGAKAFKRLYTLICVSGSVGVSLPEDVAMAILSTKEFGLAMAFNETMPDPPFLLEDGTYSFSHERHGQQFLAEHPDGEAQAREDALRSIVGAGANRPAFTSFVGSLLEAHRARGLVETALAAWDEFADKFTAAHWIECGVSDLIYTWCQFLVYTARDTTALPVMRQALEIDPDNSHTHNNYAVLLASLCETDKAREHFEQALEINSRNAEAHYNYAVLLASLGETDKVRPHYEQALEINPRYAEAHNNYAALLWSVGETDKVREHFEQALEINPRLASAHSNYALLLWSLGETDKARKHYEQALEINPRYANAHHNYANLLESLGETDKAREHREKAFEIDPTLRDRFHKKGQPPADADGDADAK